MNYQFNIAERLLLVETYVLRGLILAAIIGIWLYGRLDSMFPALLGTATLLTVFFLIEPLQNRLGTHRWLLVLFTGLIFFSITIQWFYTAFLFAVGFLSTRFNRSPLIVLDTKGILVQRLIGRQTIQWNSLQWVVLKDGVLTLDFKNNRVLQLDILPGESPIQEADFNSWAQLQVTAAN